MGGVLNIACNIYHFKIVSYFLANLIEYLFNVYLFFIILLYLLSVTVAIVKLLIYVSLVLSLLIERKRCILFEFIFLSSILFNCNCFVVEAIVNRSLSGEIIAGTFFILVCHVFILCHITFHLYYF